MNANSLNQHPLTGTFVYVYLRTATNNVVLRDGVWDGEKWLVRDLYSKNYSDWSSYGAKLIGWKER